MNSKLVLWVSIAAALSLQGCITKVVTVPVKVAYKAGKGVVKGTAAVVEAAIPDDEPSEDSKATSKQPPSKD
jgi:hypothetical protein